MSKWASSPSVRPFVMEYIESSGEFVGKHGTRLCGRLTEAPNATSRDLLWDPDELRKGVGSTVLTWQLGEQCDGERAASLRRPKTLFDGKGDRLGVCSQRNLGAHFKISRSKM